MADENWIREAMSDDSLVVYALLQLRHSEPSKKSVRQRRSNKGDQTRASPTTPLSWNGATSLSGGGGATTVEGLEESSATVKTFGSKISKTTLFKRSRKKKTLAELKEEENMLLKERKSLRNELGRMHDLVEQERARNNALKKMINVCRLNHNHKVPPCSLT